MNFKDLREELTDESIKNILSQFNVEPVYEDESSITFPTCCHNLEGGSPKLVYYKNTKLFHCYTECASSFDLFTLLQKMYLLRGKEITLKQAIAICDLDSSHLTVENESLSCNDDIRHMQKLNNTYTYKVEDINFKVYDKKILKQYTFDYHGLMPWIEEGMSMEALQRFNIRYDYLNNAMRKNAQIIKQIDDQRMIDDLLKFQRYKGDYFKSYVERYNIRGWTAAYCSVCGQPVVFDFTPDKVIITNNCTCGELKLDKPEFTYDELAIWYYNQTSPNVKKVYDEFWFKKEV